jgi:hypothetical protein
MSEPVRRRWRPRERGRAGAAGLRTGLPATTLVALAATAVIVLGVRGPDDEPAPEVAPPTGPADRQTVLAIEHCDRGADTLVNLAAVINDAGGPRGDDVIAGLREAEERMARRAAVPSEQLSVTFDALRTRLVELRRAIDAGSGVRAAFDDVLRLVDVLEEQCGVEMRPSTPR